MIKTCIIKEERLLKVYQDIYSNLAKNKLDLNYLRASKVRIFYQDTTEHMVAGYCINSSAHLRTFLPLSAEQIQKLKQENNLEDNVINEITCLWIEESLRKSTWVTCLFFMMLVDMMCCSSNIFIFGTHGKSINNYFKYCLPKILLYEQLFVPSKNEVCDFWIRQGTKYQIIKGYLKLAFIRIFFGRKALIKFRSRDVKG